MPKLPHVIQLLPHNSDVLLVVWAFVGSDDVPYCIDFNERLKALVVGTKKGENFSWRLEAYELTSAIQLINTFRF